MTRFWILWNPTYPEPPTVKFKSEEKAMVVAQKMAQLNKGDTFFVMEMISQFQVPMDVRICDDCGLEDCTDPGGCYDDGNDVESTTDLIRPEPVCECGAEKCRSNIHSNWCPRSTK